MQQQQQEEEKHAFDGGDEQLDRLSGRTNLTRNQLGFWLIQRLNSADTSCNMGSLYRLEGELDPSIFNAAFQAMLDGTDALRVFFSTRNNEPVQCFRDTLTHEVEVVDLSAHEPDRHYVERWCADRISRPLNVGERCFDTTLLKLGRKRWAWYLCVHHVVIDAYSMNLVFDRVAAAYASHGTTIAGDDRPRFDDFVAAEQRYRSSDAASADGKYWSNRLPSDGRADSFFGRQRPADHNSCKRLGFDISESLSCALRDQAFNVCGNRAGKQLTKLIAYLTIVSSFHQRTASSRTVTIGVPFHNRSTPAEKKTAGLLMELVPLTIEVHADDTFADHCRKWHEEIQRSIRHYRYGSINPPRKRRYDTMLNLVPASAREFSGIPVDTQWVHSGHWNEALTVQIQCNGQSGSDRIYLDLNEVIFESPYSDSAVSLFRGLIGAMADCVGNSIGDVHGSTAEEVAALQTNVGRAGRRIGRHDTIVAHFYKAMALNRNRPAVVCTNRTTTYEELDKLSDQVAIRICELGVIAGDAVGFSLPRSVEMIATILGILKAGCAYVPIDHAYPRARIETMLADAEISLILSNAERSDGFPAPSDVTLEDIVSFLHQCVPVVKPVDRWKSSTSDSCAYVNFTSGSTGRPKGVQVSHGGVVRLVVGADYAELTAVTRILQMSTISFDAATFEIWSALLCGGALIVHADGTPSAASIRRLSRSHGVNMAFLTTSVFNAIVDEDISALSDIDQLITGGEAASMRHFQALRSRYPGMRLINAYGPTECTTYTTCYQVPPAAEMVRPVPIGKTISNTDAFVLDESMYEVPMGVVGTLFVGGPGLAIGYLKQPEKTAASFVVGTKGRCKGIRLYNTGDRVRLLPSGDLEFVGRLDNQVKIRGVRVEIDEVEGCLANIPGVNRAVVIHVRFDRLEQGLAAYVVTSDPTLDAAQLRLAAHDVLPRALVPRWITILDDLPIGDTGKVDRHKLPVPNLASTPLSHGAGPRHSLDSELLSIWSEILRLKVADIDQNLFDLGGDSISAIRIASRISNENVAVEAIDVFEAETIRALADRIEELRSVRSTIDDSAKVTPAASQVSDDEMRALMSELNL